MLKIKRYSAWTDGFRKYKIFLDGKEIGTIKDGQELEFPIDKGEHELVLKIDWCRSKTITFHKENKNIEFECVSNLKGLKIFLVLVYITLKYSQYIRLEQIR